MQVSIKKKADLENCLGKSLAGQLLKRRSSQMKRVPSWVTFCEQKPSFAVDDNGTLRAYAVNLESGQILNERYCGSGESAINHLDEQFNETATAPFNHALVFVETFWNGRNHSWSVTVVSKNVTKQVG